MTRPQRMVTDRQLDSLMSREIETYETRTPRSRAVFAQRATTAASMRPWFTSGRMVVWPCAPNTTSTPEFPSTP